MGRVEAISAELARQESALEMIASEDFAPLVVMQAQGSVLTTCTPKGILNDTGTSDQILVRSSFAQYLARFLLDAAMEHMDA